MASGEIVAHSLTLDFCSACCRILILTSNAFLAQKKNIYIYIKHYWEALLLHDIYSGLMEVPNMSLFFLGFCVTKRPSVNFLRPAPSHPQCLDPELCHVAWPPPLTPQSWDYLLPTIPGLYLYFSLVSSAGCEHGDLGLCFTPFCVPPPSSPLREAHSVFVSQEPSCMAWLRGFLLTAGHFPLLLHFAFQWDIDPGTVIKMNLWEVVEALYKIWVLCM